MDFFSKNIKKILFFIFLILIFIFLNIYQNQTRNFFYLISSPFQSFFWQLGKKVSNFFATIQEIKNLKKENEELKAKNQFLIAENLSLRELKKENEILKNALNLGLEKDFRLVFVQVISKDISDDYLLINKGKKDGILKDFPVITEEKNVVGKISEAYDNFSKVILISNKNFFFDVKVAEKEIYGVAKGKGGLKISVEQLPKDKEIEKGNILITAALGGVFPPNLLVGEILEVKKSDIEPFQKAELKPFFDFKKSNLFVIILP